MSDAVGEDPSGTASIPSSRGRKAAGVEDFESAFKKVESWLVDSGSCNDLIGKKAADSSMIYEARKPI